jgi:bifunctional polynucleotide phosphatase/kinase
MGVDYYKLFELLSIDFATPEEFFLGEKPAPFEWGSPDPNQYLKSDKPAPGGKDYMSKVKMIPLLK